jgi:predicted MFS family arabinose efflux permease
MHRLLGLEGLNGPLYRLSLAVFLFSFSEAGIIFLMLYLTEALGFPVAQAGLVLGMFGLGAIGGSYLGGWVCDRLPARNVLALLMAATGISIGVIGLISNPGLLAALLFLLGAVRGGVRPAYSVVMMGIVGDAHRSQAFSVYLTAVNLGAGMAAAAAAWLVPFGYAPVFAMSGAMAIGAGLMALWTVPSETPAEAVVVRNTDLPQSSPFADPAFLVFCGAILAWAFIAGQTRSTYPVYLTDRYGIDPSGYGLLWTLNMTLAVLCSVPLAAVIKRFDRCRAIMAASVLFCAGLALLPYGEGPGFVGACMVAFTLGGISLWPLLVATVLQRGEAVAAAGRYMGLYNALFSSGNIMAPVIGSAVYAAYGGDAVWHLVALSGAASVFLAFAAFRWTARPLGG